MQFICYIKDAKGDVIARILGRQWEILNASEIEFNADDSAFEIVDAERRVYFQLRLSDGGAHFQGILCSGFGGCFAIDDINHIHPFTQESLPQRFLIPPYVKIAPVFKYPRKDNPGVRASSTGE